MKRDTCIVHEPTTPIWACATTRCGGSRPSDSFLSRSEGLDHAKGLSKRLMFASGGGLSEGYELDGLDGCLGDGQAAVKPFMLISVSESSVTRLDCRADWRIGGFTFGLEQVLER